MYRTNSYDDRIHKPDKLCSLIQVCKPFFAFKFGSFVYLLGFEVLFYLYNGETET